jgi:hypothetical protein
MRLSVMRFAALNGCLAAGESGRAQCLAEAFRAAFGWNSFASLPLYSPVRAIAPGAIWRIRHRLTEHSDTVIAPIISVNAAENSNMSIRP